MKKKLSVIGCGRWGCNFVETLSKLDRLEAICDSDELKADTVSLKYNIPALSFFEILNSNVDGVVIALPSAHHYHFTRMALLAGKHVLVEKPITLDLQQALELESIAIHENKILMVGHLMQYHPCYTHLKDFIKDNNLGKIHHIISYRTNLKNFEYAENVLWDLAPHDLSMVLGLVGSFPEKINTRGECNYLPGLPDTALTTLYFAEGIYADIFVSWSHHFKESRLTVTGDNGMMIFDDCLPWPEKLKFHPQKTLLSDKKITFIRERMQLVPVCQKEPLKEECLHFIECIEKSQQPKTGAAEGISILRILETSQKQIDTEADINNKISN